MAGIKDNEPSLPGFNPVICRSRHGST